MYSSEGSTIDQLSLVTCGSSRTKGAHDEIATRHLLSVHASAVPCSIGFRSRPSSGSAGAKPTTATGSDLSHHRPGHHLPGKLYGF